MTERNKYIRLDTLWEIIDTLASEIDIRLENPLYSEGECSRMFLVGQRELLEKVIESISDPIYSMSLSEVQEQEEE